MYDKQRADIVSTEMYWNYWDQTGGRGLKLQIRLKCEKINQIIRLNVTDVKEVKEMLKHYYVRPRPSPFAITLIPNNICVTPIIPCTWPVSSLADRSKRSKKYLHFHTNVSKVLNKLHSGCAGQDSRVWSISNHHVGTISSITIQITFHPFS